MIKSSIQGVSNSEVDADLEQIVLQNNEPLGLTINACKIWDSLKNLPGVKEGSIAQDPLESVE